MVLALFLTAPLWLAPARASCAAPEISIEEFEAAPGDELEVRGRFWTDTCDDTGGSSGCTEDEFERGHPVQDIRLVLEKRGSDEEIFLTEVDAGEGFGFRTQVVIPEVEPGLYRILDARGMGYFSPDTFRIRRTSS